jgi:hypothetical protein
LNEEKKLNLKEANRQYVKCQRLKEAFQYLDTFCEQNYQDKLDTLYFILTQELIDAGKKSEADRILSIWKASDPDSQMSAADCLAMRVRTLQSKTHYRQAYSIQKEKTSSNSKRLGQRSPWT